MKILVDADACPVVSIVERIAKEQNIEVYTNDNIEQMLMERHINKKARRAKGKRHIKGPIKRTVEDDRRFEDSFIRLIEKMKDV